MLAKISNNGMTILVGYDVLGPGILLALSVVLKADKEGIGVVITCINGIGPIVIHPDGDKCSEATVRPCLGPPKLLLTDFVKQSVVNLCDFCLLIGGPLIET